MKKITFKFLVCSLGLISCLSTDAQIVFQEDFNSSLGQTTASNGSNGNWVWTNSCARSSMSGHSTTGSAIFQGSGCNFGNSYNTVSGNLTTSAINIGPLGAILTFNYYLQNECTAWGPDQPCFYDRLDLLISNNGGASYNNLMTSSNTPTYITNGTVWKSVSYTLTAFASQTIYLRFNFNSIDGAINNFDGAYVDDIKVENIQPCAGTPASNTVVATSTLLCPGFGTADLSLLNGYAFGGLTYTWLSSTVSPVGPFSVVPNASLTVMTTPTLGVNTWYQAVITCTNSAQSTTPAVMTMSVAATTTNSIPYFEGFEGITKNNQYPNCSWISNSPTVICQTYTSTQTANRVARTGSKYAAFYTYYVSGDNYFYTNGLQMYAGITYSASMWYTTEYYGYTNVTDLSMLVGPNQSTTGLVPIASTGGPAASPIYKALTNTFTVPSDGIYYVAIKTTGNGNYGVQWLSWDDLEIIIPCSLNSPTVSLSASSATICSGDVVNLTANGADSYSWSTGATGSSISDMPNSNTLYSVTGMNDLTGCPDMKTQMIIVNPAPQISIFANKPVVCAGEPVNLSAFGAISYTWGNSSNNPVITVTANATSIFTVLGSNAFNCSSTSTVQIIVNPNPVVTVTSLAPDQSKMCKGESVTLVGGGAGSTGTYQWASAALFIQAMSAIISPNTTTTYTLTGIDANGCMGTTTYVQNVDECTGVNEITTTLSGIRVYPNPTAGIFTVELNNAKAKTIQVIDLTGRVVFTNTSNNEKVNVNIGNLANGIYHVKIQSNDAVEVIKIVKE